ncbi:MAG: RAD55 family ATPase [Vulcanimicrobiota bacterium]
MHKELVPGLDQIIKKNVEPGQVVLITGAAGTLKSVFTFFYESNYIDEYNKYGIYITLEQTKESHLAAMESIGFKMSNNLLLSDYNNMRRDMRDEKEYEIDIISSIKIMISKLKKDLSDNLAFFALDSMNALYTLSRMKNPRVQVHSLFTYLRDNNLISFMIKEHWEHGMSSDLDVQETYLVDGIINLGIMDDSNKLNRYIQITKMRGAHHDLKKYQIDIKNSSLMIMSPLYE